MYELFLTASVKKDDFEIACAILQGLTWMQARQNVHRILYFAGQPQPRGLPNQRCFRQSPALPLWNELGKQLGRSSYVLQLAYEVFRETDFGTGRAIDLNAVPGTLRWTDLPDPLRDTLVIQRKKIEILDQPNLVTVMADNGHSFKNELIQEAFTFVRENVEFVFSRMYHLPEPSPGRPATALPAWSDLRPVDPAQKWVLNVKLNVAEDNQPDKLQKGNKELLAVKEELDKLFDFKILDRRVLDTRIAPPQILPPR
ncbi:hypothetical protein DL764_004483 [Monosporascus ibericus]|uniref:Mediator of RNA polymerase II transcription subunit 18 n=1 Tax=Monosporascus ibericus TaxID=155417 RepID=A0A4V1XAY7_9PEZI|nr:hypothetical protein DL764_004483 [Monosporascus ibericus]